MARLSEVIADKVGMNNAIELIQHGTVKLNGQCKKSDEVLYPYDVIEFDENKVCYLGYNLIIENYNHVH